MKEEEVEAKIAAQEEMARMSAEEKFISAKIGRRSFMSAGAAATLAALAGPRSGAGSRGDGSRGNR